MMGIKVMLHAVIFSLVFSMLVKHQVWGEYDCYREKVAVMLKCNNSIKKGGPYVRPRPGDKCCTTVQASDTACICRLLTTDDEETVEPKRLVKAAYHCGKPVPVGSKCGSKSIILFTFLYKMLVLSKHHDRSF
ncbi:hypothetical protein HU200_033037 [Digitaria exilis]|uniref:Bifunctional inhibitor/plant lipid transfer protein/seed storage helical domain-containing protein n=1 Tax=Digitaria exilis TaxID=1010633 RepID=A0A835BLV3_9POAL|nr:hypothetical protein HU200_033037 [Digitaria exilis]